jgi:hypothetical protein
MVGQQRKLKEIINWLKKKKRRTIRKDELISFLIGKQVSYTNSNNNLSSIFSSSTSATPSSSSNTNSGCFYNNASLFNQSQLPSSGAVTGNGNSLGVLQSTGGNSNHQNVFFGNAKQQIFRPSPAFASSQSQQQQQQQQPHQSRLSNSNTNLLFNANSATCPSNLSSLNQSSLVDTSSDLATFREALIMHSKCLETSINKNCLVV